MSVSLLTQSGKSKMAYKCVSQVDWGHAAASPLLARPSQYHDTPVYSLVSFWLVALALSVNMFRFCGMAISALSER